jgi:hypothetical protein
MRFNETTHIISICVLILTAIYTLVYSGISGILLCAAVAFIAAAFINDIELVVAVTILFVLLYNMVLKRYLRRFEGFTPGAITNMLRKDRDVYEKQFAGESAVARSFSNPAYMEGFENVDPTKSEHAEAANTAIPAVNPTAVKEITTAINEKFEEKQNETKEEKEEFQSATNELFKLGKMPSEHKDGPILDAGGTLMKAMSSFDPETTQKMTQDTKQLLETQKSLMNMLTQMRPILADGKELLQTFSGMFGQGGANPAQFALAK